MLYLVICGDVAADEISSHLSVYTPPALQLSLHTITLHCYYFYHFKGCGADEITSGLDFPGGNLCHAEKNIKNTERHTTQQYVLCAQVANSNPLPRPVGAPTSGVVVESGPVVYDDAAAVDDEDDEEEEACVSAMELMGSNGQFNHIVLFNLECISPGPSHRLGSSDF